MSQQIWDPIFRARQGLRYWPSEDLIRFLSRWTQPEKARALDLGTGTGASCWALWDHAGFDEIVAMDSSAEALGIAKEYLERRQAWADLLLGDIRALPFPEGYFDLVLDLQCIQHLTKKEHLSAYQEVSRVMRPGAAFFSLHLGAGTRNYPRLFPACGPVWLPYASELMDVMKEAGLAVTSINTVERSYDDRSLRQQLYILDAVKP